MNLDFFRKILGKSSQVARPQQPGSEQNDLHKRLQQIYGEQQIELQLRYEKWAIRESWQLKDEALPLLCGLEPGTAIFAPAADQPTPPLDELWSHAQSCVQQGLLPVINREQPSADWRVRPLDVYRWAKVSRISVPEVLNTLMDFVARTIKSETTGTSAQTDDHVDRSAHFDQNRETVLGVALALLAAYPEQCRNQKGRVQADKILRLMDEKGGFWSNNAQVDFSSMATRDLINKWLNTLPVQD